MLLMIPRFLPIDPQADPMQRLVVVSANQCARLFDLAGCSVSLPLQAADVVPYGDTMRAGALLAALELRQLLAQFAQGRQALRDLGFEPVFEHVEGK